jgi:hypothetical protein
LAVHWVDFSGQIRAYLITKSAASVSVYSLGINTASGGGGSGSAGILLLTTMPAAPKAV